MRTGASVFGNDTRTARATYNRRVARSLRERLAPRLGARNARQLGNTARVASGSKDKGETWGTVCGTELPNPGSGLDAVRLASGNWLLVYNNTTKGRNSLAVSLSDDEGKSWKWTRHLEKQDTGSYHYPSVIQAKDGSVHAVYSYFVADGKSMKHARFNEAWVKDGDPK